MALSDFSPTPAHELDAVREELHALAERVIGIGLHSRLPTTGERQHYANIHSAMHNFETELFYLSRAESLASGGTPVVVEDRDKTRIRERK